MRTTILVSTRDKK